MDTSRRSKEHLPEEGNVLLAGDVAKLCVEPPLVAAVEDGGEDEEDGDGAERVELGEEGGRLQVDEGEDDEDEEEGHGAELAPDRLKG